MTYCDFKPGDEVVCINAVGSRFTRLRHRPVDDGQPADIRRQAR